MVTGQRLRGAVEGDVEPIEQLDEAQIRAQGATSIAELVERLSPQTRTGRGRDGGGPIVLLNGRRIAGFGEIRDLPPKRSSGSISCPKRSRSPTATAPTSACSTSC